MKWEPDGTCPTCGGDCVEGEGVEIEHPFAMQKCICESGHSWVDTYRLVFQCVIPSGFGDVRALWARLGMVPVDDDGVLQERFLQFPPGTQREEVWHWFEEEFSCSVVGLMYPSCCPKCGQSFFVHNDGSCVED